MRVKFSSFWLVLITLTFAHLPLEAVPFRLKLRELAFIPDGDDWGPRASLGKTFLTKDSKEEAPEEVIEVRLTSEKELSQYSLEPTDPSFPSLDLSDTASGKASREVFFVKLEKWEG